MPLHEYECQKCRRQFERIESFSGPHLKKCPKCGAKVERLVAAPAFQFKGSGWYVTDYARASKAADSDKKEKPEKESKASPAKKAPKAPSASKDE